MSTGRTDLTMYREIVAHMEAGQGYYLAAAEAHRANGYPLFPFYTVRLPTLATFNALVGPTGSLVFGILILVVAALVWFRYLEKDGRLAQYPAVVMISVISGNGLLQGNVAYIHDWWAGIFLTIAAGLWKDWRLSLPFAVLAALVRELAFPFLLLYFLVYRREKALGIVGLATVACGVFYIAHFLEVSTVRLPSDLASQGWFGLRGPAAFVSDVVKLTDLYRLQPWGALLTIVAGLGWLTSRNRLAQLWLVGVIFAVSIFSRPDNFYWAQMALPVYFIGLVFLVAGAQQRLSRRPSADLRLSRSDRTFP